MTYSSVADIYKANEEVRARLIARVESLDEAAQNFRAGEEAWSAAEIVEHLATIEHRLSQLAAMMVGKVEGVAAATAGDGGEASEAGAHFKPFSLDEQVEHARTRKFIAPEEVRPVGGVVLSASLARLRVSRAALEALRPRVERADLSAATYPHPAFGPLNLYQWLAFIGIHEQRHLDQLERQLGARGES